jgi:hypothetical protein
MVASMIADAVTTTMTQRRALPLSGLNPHPFPPRTNPPI